MCNVPLRSRGTGRKFWYVIKDQTFPWTLGENPKTTWEQNLRDLALCRGDTTLNDCFEREGTVSHFLLRWIEILHHGKDTILWRVSNSKLKLLKIHTLRSRIPTNRILLLFQASITSPLKISVPDDDVTLLSVYFGFICYVMPDREQSTTC